MLKIITIAFLSMVLFSCTSVKDTRAFVQEDFVGRADHVELKTSNFKASKQRFNQSFLEYSIVDARQSGVSESDAKLTDAQRTKVTVESNVVDWLLFDSPYPHDYSYFIDKKTYHIESKSTFGFTLVDTSARKQKVSCGNFHIDQTQFSESVSSSNENKGERGSESIVPGTRLNTFLSCKFSSEKGQSLLSLELPYNTTPKMNFTNSPQDWKILPITRYYQVLSDHRIVTSDELPPWMSKVSGFEIFYKGEQIAAISTAQNPHIWIQKNIDAELRNLTTSLLYAIFMFNDADNHWS